MARDIANHTRIENLESLVQYFEAGYKSLDEAGIGTEHEKFPFYLSHHTAVPYEGVQGISKILEFLRDRLLWHEIRDHGFLIGLYDPSGSGAISLEPGGQLELSGAVVKTVHETCVELRRYSALTHEIGQELGISFLSIGASPLWRLDDIPDMPKSRYKIMKNYMPQVGSQGLNMMYRTATIQTNLDYFSEKDMQLKMRVSMKIQPLVSALFACSPFCEGRLSDYLSWRSEIWQDTDNARSGLLPFVFSDNFGFIDYINWALDVPMYFVLRDGVYYPATHVTFRQFMAGKLQDEVPEGHANIGDWANHLSTLFPDVRLKQFIEMRGADAGPLPHICALSAFWTGLLYDQEALLALQDLTQDWTYEDVSALRRQVPLTALKTELKGKKLQYFAQEILKIAEGGLSRRAKFDDDGQDETIYLSVLKTIASQGVTEADKLYKAYENQWQKQIDMIFTDSSYVNPV